MYIIYREDDGVIWYFTGNLFRKGKSNAYVYNDRKEVIEKARIMGANWRTLRNRE